jgi:hypothetical protein
MRVSSGLAEPGGSRADGRAASGTRRGSALTTMAAWIALASVDLVLRLGGFGALYKVVAWWPTVGEAPLDTRASRTERACLAVARAQSFYLKRAWCLQSAAAAVLLLRSRGVRGELVIGVRKLPFRAHAWAEVDQRVVINTEARLQEFYTVMSRC